MKIRTTFKKIKSSLNKEDGANPTVGFIGLLKLYLDQVEVLGIKRACQNNPMIKNYDAVLTRSEELEVLSKKYEGDW